MFIFTSFFTAGSVLSMLLNAFGEELWKKALSIYLFNLSFDFATPEDLADAITLAAFSNNVMNLPNIHDVLESWESQSGFPYITVSRSGSQMTFDQDRFMYSNRNSTNLWHVPINYVVGSNPDFSSTLPDFWMSAVRRKTIESATAPKSFTASDWIVVNVQQTGYYRVNYDADLWNLLIQQLNGDDFEEVHIINRAQLVDDSFHLARAGLLRFDIPLAIIDHMEREVDYIPWAPTNRANTLLNRWFAGSRVHPRYQEFMRKNVQRAFNKLGTSVVADEPRVDRYARIIAINIACQAQLPACLTQTTQSLQNMFASGDPLEPDLVSSVYCNGMRTASEETYSDMLYKLQASNDPAERNLIITSIGCTQNIDLLTDFFTMAIAPGADLTRGERSRILTSAVNMGEASVRTMIEFFKIQFTAISSYNLIAIVASNIAARIHNQDLFNQFSSVLGTLEAAELLSPAEVVNLRSTANRILDWQKANLGIVEEFFNQQDNKPTTVESTTVTTSTTVEQTTSTKVEDTTLGAGSVALSTVLLLLAFVIKQLL